MLEAQIRILLIDDNPDDFIVTRDVLARSGADAFHLDWVETYREGRDALLAQSHDAYLIDYKLGTDDGISLLCEAMQGGCPAPMLVLTGNGNSSVDERAMRSGAADYVDKTEVATAPHLLARAIRHAIERKEIERDLMRSKHDFRRVIENSPDLLGLRRGARFVYANPSLVATLGYDDASELLAHDVLDLLHPDEREHVRACFEAFDTYDTPVMLNELRLVRPDGEVITIELSPMRHIHFEGERVALLQGRDVTDQRKMRGRLMLADRMLTAGTLAAGVAHAINNPLTYIISNLAYVNDKLGGLERVLPRDRVEDLREAIAQTREGADKVRRAVSEMQRFCAADESAERAIDVRDALDWALDVCVSQIEQRARVVKDYGDVPLIRGSQTRLGHVFLNLLVNAAQAFVEKSLERNEIRLRTFQAGGGVVVEVIDTGPGMPPHIVSRVFDPFFTTKPIGEGVGIGLAVCHNVIDSMGGEISLESAVGVGTTFRVSLPADRPDPVVRQPTPVTGVEIAAAARVLIVDDEPLIALSIRRILRGHEVLVARDAEAALRLCESESFDILLCDLSMPGMSGIELYQELLRRDSPCAAQVVFMTGGAMSQESASFIESFPNPTITKPFDITVLRDLVRSRAQSPAPTRVDP